MTGRTGKHTDKDILVQSQETQEYAVAFAVKHNLFTQDYSCEATLLQTNNLTEVKYPPPGKKYPTALIGAPKLIPKSF